MARKMNVEMNIIARKKFNLQLLVAFKSRYFSWKVCDLNFGLWIYALCHFLKYSAEKKVIFVSLTEKTKTKNQKTKQKQTLSLFFPSMDWLFGVVKNLVWLKHSDEFLINTTFENFPSEKFSNKMKTSYFILN